MIKTCWNLGCIFGGSAVILGAFGAHSLKSILEKRADPEISRKLGAWETAVKYQFIHSLALLALDLKGVALNALPVKCFTAGILLFSGSIYLLTTLNNTRIKKFLGPITPLGGLLLIGGWTAAL